MGRTIKILAVLPYKGLDTIIKKVAKEFTNFEFVYEKGELDKGIEIAQQYVGSDIDAIISRGGTARLIASAVKIPTFDIGITTNDLINTITLAKNTLSQKMCLVGFHEVTNASRYLDRLLEKPLPIFVTYSAKENIELMKQLKQENYELIIGDATSVRFAKNEGLNNIMITSGEDSVRQCLEQVSALFAMSQDNNDLLSIQRNILKNLEATFFMLTGNEEICHSQISSEDLALISPGLMREVSKSLAKKYKKHEIQKKINFDHESSSWIVCLKKDIFKNEEVILVIWQRLNSIDLDSRKLLKDLSNATYPFQIESFNSKDTKMCQAISDGKTFAEGKSPILIVGESFTGRQSMAHMIYNLSSFGKGGFYCIDLLSVTEEQIKDLFLRSKSFLTSLSLTLVVKNLQKVDKKIANIFLRYIHKSGFCKHSRLICIFDHFVDTSNEDDVALTRFLLSSLESLVVTLPPLRERPGDLMFLATLALGQFCSAYGKNCAGFTKDAQEFLLHQSWPGNQHELRGVIRQVVATLNKEYIDLPELKSEIDKWQSLYEAKPKDINEDLLHGTLEQIENKIILAVLKEEHGHKTKVTQRLKISRNTLWRKLKEIGVE